MSTFEQQLNAAIGAIDRDELAELALAIAAIPSPTGEEQAVGDFIVGWLNDQGIHAFAQHVEEGRVNAVGIMPGASGGQSRSLMFNGHMDTGGPMPHERAHPGVAGQLEFMEPYEEDGILYGTGMDNMKSGLAAFLGAMVALHRSGAPLSGDLIGAGVCGEIGLAPVDQYKGPHYRIKGVGTRYLLTHGIVSDYALVADTSHFGLTWAECGVVYAKVSTHGLALYTPFTKRHDDPAQSDNAIIQMGRVIDAIEHWAPGFESRNVVDFELGQVNPKVSIGAIAGGTPFKVANTPVNCSVYVDIRMPPGMRPIEAMREFRAAVTTAGVDTSVEFYISQRGYVAEGVEPLADAVREAHEQVTGTGLREIAPVESSMWTDTNLYNELGIPAVKFGIGAVLREAADGEMGGFQRIPNSTSVDDLVKAMRIYTATALRVCGSDGV
jgi:acetylornithine deacetylase/succinyl-diaminopimelate desuccinylase-like protein